MYGTHNINSTKICKQNVDQGLELCEVKMIIKF